MIKNFLLTLLTLIFFVVVFTGGFFYWGVYVPKSSQEAGSSFNVNSGEGLSVVAENLEKQGLVKSKYFFLFYGIIKDKGKSLKPGNYNLSPSMTVSEIMSKLIQGNADRITIAEGWNLRDIAKILESEGYGDSDDFFRLAGTPPSYRDGEVSPVKEGELKLEAEILSDKKEGVSLEGYFFPDTYFVDKGTPLEEVIISMVLNFEKKITPEIEEKIKESSYSFFEIITIASLIEREVFLPEDRKVVSGIIQKRIEKGMRLQMDATITYLTGGRSVQIPITETKIYSPYNTYYYEGLPKGPICNPGIDSIVAALSPKETDYLYYLSKPDGETVFSKTHDEHVRAKKLYLR